MKSCSNAEWMKVYLMIRVSSSSISSAVVIIRVLAEKALCVTIIRVNSAFFRPAEVEMLVGDPVKATETLNWQANTTLEALCRMMVEADLRRQDG